jgi:hypothetical protein
MLMVFAFTGHSHNVRTVISIFPSLLRHGWLPDSRHGILADTVEAKSRRPSKLQYGPYAIAVGSL